MLLLRKLMLQAQRTAAQQDAAGASAELQQQVDNLKAEAVQAAKRVRSKWSCRRREMGQAAMIALVGAGVAQQTCRV